MYSANVMNTQVTTTTMSDGVSCIDGTMRSFQMTMVADALGDDSEPEHRIALQYVA